MVDLALNEAYRFVYSILFTLILLEEENISLSLHNIPLCW